MQHGSSDSIICMPRMGYVQAGSGPKSDNFTISAAIAMNHVIHCKLSKAIVNYHSVTSIKR